jgi:50S ribosomal subunit-associated GTPase HflX
VALNKIDTVAEDIRQKKMSLLQKSFTSDGQEQFVVISAVTGENLETLISELFSLVKKNDTENKSLDQISRS